MDDLEPPIVAPVEPITPAPELPEPEQTRTCVDRAFAPCDALVDGATCSDVPCGFMLDLLTSLDLDLACH